MHPKSSDTPVNLSLKSTHFPVHVGILAVEVDFLKWEKKKKRSDLYEYLVEDIIVMIY